MAIAGLVWIVLAFGAIHLIEFSSYMARVAGVRNEKHVSGYALQNAIYVFTRFFYLTLMPILGLTIDVGVARSSYLLTVHCALLFAAMASVMALAIRHRIARFFGFVLEEMDGAALHVAVSRAIRSASVAPHTASASRRTWGIGEIRDWWLVAMSACVFTAYSMGVFASFFIALVFPDYRAAISQLSGVINGAATVLLTFFIEPRLSARIDARSNDVESTVAEILWGRLIGVGACSHLVVLALWVVAWVKPV